MNALAPLALCLAVPALSAAPAKSGAYKTDDERAIYTIGFLMGRNVATFNFTPAEVKILQAGIGDSVASKQPAVDIHAYQPQVNELLQKRMSAGADKEKAKGKAFADAFVKERKAAAIPGGGWYAEEKAGTGPAPLASDTVKVHYRGTTVDGEEFDSSYSRNEPTEFALNRVIPCWTNGIALMKAGGKGRLVCPSDVAYGDRGRPGIKPGATLIFDVELLEIVKSAGTGADAKPDAKK